MAMSSITIILAVGAALVLAGQCAIAVWYKRRFGTLLTPSARPRFKEPVPHDLIAIFSLFTLGLMMGLAAPVFWPDAAFAQWLREPYATPVYFAACFAGMFVLTFARAVAIVLWKRT
jgi:uncharacterized iron-regulated membrane protein